MWLLVCFDIEATGRSPYTDRITQLAAVVSALSDPKGQILSSFNEYVYTPKPLSTRVRAFNGITRVMLRDADAAPAVLQRWEAWLSQQMVQFQAEGCVLAAHNGTRLDFPMIFHHYLLLCGLPPLALPATRLPPDRFLLLDTLPMLRALSHQVSILRSLPSFALDALHAQLCGSAHAAHDALHDATALLSVLRIVLAQPEVGSAVALVAPLADPLSVVLQAWGRRLAADQATEAEEDRRKRCAAEEAERAALVKHNLKKQSEAAEGGKKKKKNTKKTTTSQSVRKATPSPSTALESRAHSLPASPIGELLAPLPSPQRSLSSASAIPASSSAVPSPSPSAHRRRDLSAAFEALALADAEEAAPRSKVHGELHTEEINVEEEDEEEWDVGSASDAD